jgi:hypothetical protein
MKEFLKKNWSLLTVGLITVVLAVIALGTAWKLYQAGREPVAPTAPVSVPKAQEEPTSTPTPEEPCVLEFEVPSGTPTPTPTGTVTPTPTPVPECWEECTDECSGDLVCQDVEGTDRCVNKDCPEEEDCECPGATPTPTPTPGPTATPTPTPTPGPTSTPTPTPTPKPGVTTTPTPTPVELPSAGISLPTIGVLLGGILLVVLSAILAL